MASPLLTVLLMFVAEALGQGLDPHIIGGEEATIGAWPWQGSLQTRIGDGHICGCSLISTTWVVTAAHCVKGKQATDLKVVLGLHDHNDRSKGKPANYLISRIISHPGYAAGNDDMALVKLSTLAELNDYVQPIALPDANDNFDNKNCYITGWGVTEIGGSSTASRLHEAAVTAFTNQFCGGYWPGLSEGHICCGVIGQRGACFGDSGGPLVCDIGSGYVLAGLTSFGNIDCDPADNPSVYTRITHYRIWIWINTGGL